MVDISFNQTQTMNMNMTSSSFMAATNNSGIGGSTVGLGFEDIIDPFFDHDWLQEHNLDILFDLFEQEIGSKNSYDVGANNSSNLFGSSPVTSYLYGTSPTLASVLDLNDWLYYDTPISETSTQTTTIYANQPQQLQQPNQQTQQYGYMPIDNNNLITSNGQSIPGSNNCDNKNKTKVNGLYNKSCGSGSGSGSGSSSSSTSGRSISSRKNHHVASAKKLASINNKLTSNISKLNLNNSNLNNSPLGTDKNVINFVNGDNNHHHHNNSLGNNYSASDTNSLTSRMRIKRRSKKGQSEGTSLLAKPPLSTSNANNSNITSKINSTSSNKSGNVASNPTDAIGSNNVIKNVSMNFEPSPNVAIAHRRQMNNSKQNNIGDKISRMIHSKKQTTIFKVTTSEAICIDRSKQPQNKNRMSFNNTNLLIPIHHKQLNRSSKDYATDCAITIEHAYALRLVS